MREDRDTCIISDYQTGMNVPELSRTYGVTPRRVSQILTAAEVDRRPRVKGEKQVISREHQRIGQVLYDYRFDRGLQPNEAANELGWTVVKLRRVEQGLSEVELLDLIDISTYTETPIEKLVRGSNG